MAESPTCPVYTLPARMMATLAVVPAVEAYPEGVRAHVSENEDILQREHFEHIFRVYDRTLQSQ